MTLVAITPRHGAPAATDPAGAGRTPGPLRKVVTALESGADTRGRVAVASGLDRELVDSVLDHLIRLGRVRSEPLAGGCPTTSCGACPSGRTDGSAGCGSLTRAAGRGPVAVTLVGRYPG